METSFLSGSENLYKYLVSVGILLIALTVFYPLKEKQNIEIKTIGLEKELSKLNLKIKDNYKKVLELKKDTISIPKEKIEEIEKINLENHLNQIEVEKSNDEIKKRKKHISLYYKLFWIFFPLGIILTIYGFFKWLKSKKTDDEILKLEKRLKELEVEKLERERPTT